jgi:hypothetical protein
MSDPGSELPGMRFPWWILLWSVVLPCLYLPTLTTRFDFNDDGNLVYPSPPASLGHRLHVVWAKTVADYREHGPFRPAAWAHWEAAADLLGPCALYRRAAWLAWAALGAGALLWLLHELGIRQGAAVLTAALAMWNPYRSEIWVGLAPTEAMAMPYALLGLVCAIRAARSQRQWAWDVAGTLAVLVALSCKNTFAAVVPAQVWLRVVSGGFPLHEGWRRHGRRACLLAVSLSMPVTHYVLFKLDSHAGQFTTACTWAQLGRMLRAVAGAVSLDFMGAALVLAAVVVWLSKRTATPAQPERTPPTPSTRADAHGFWETYRAAMVAGFALLVFGIGIYLPIDGVAGRYAIPAAWGADLGIAVLLSALAAMPAGSWQRTAYAVYACGLLAVVVANLGKQDKFAARADLLWQALECVERQAPAGACIAWVGSPAADARNQELDLAEGCHFGWHLQARGRRDIAVQLLDDRAASPVHVDRRQEKAEPTFLLRGTRVPPAGGAWQLLRKFQASYWLGKRSYHCYLWVRNAGGPS